MNSSLSILSPSFVREAAFFPPESSQFTKSKNTRNQACFGLVLTRNRGLHGSVREPLLLSACMLQTKKIMALNIIIARGHTITGVLTNEVVRPAIEQNSKAPIAFLKPASLRNARRPMTEAARRAATATNPRIRGV